MEILDGRRISGIIRGELRSRVDELRSRGRRVPRLVIVSVGNDSASKVYIRNKVRACRDVGYDVEVRELSPLLSIISDKDDLDRLSAVKSLEVELELLIDSLNADDSVDGFIVQLPLPEGIDECRILERIDYRKDVDGLHPMNVGRTVLGMRSLVSATPKGIRELLRRYGISTLGKRVVVIGRSNIVGKPMAMLLMQKPYLSLGDTARGSFGDATVTLCHSKTVGLREICLEADILIVAAGQPGLLRGDMVREGAVVVDVGINRLSDGRLVGDVDYEGVSNRCSYISPVPGGVGPMTVVSLLENVMEAYEFMH